MVDEIPDNELVARARAGDETCVEHLLYRHYDAVQGYVRARMPADLRPAVGIEDVLQSAFADVFREIVAFEPHHENAFKAWLLRIADHRLTDAVRRHKRLKRGGGRKRVEARRPGSEGSILEFYELLCSEDPRASQIARREEAVAALGVAIAGLPDDQRRAVTLRYLEGRELTEVAEMMERSPDSVRGLVQRAKKRLRESLGRASLWLSRG